VGRHATDAAQDKDHPHHRAGDHEDRRRPLPGVHAAAHRQACLLCRRHIDTAAAGRGEEETETSKKRPRPALAPVTDDERSGFTVQGLAATKKRKIKCEVKVEDRKELGFDGYEYELGRRP
jgi:hypothetical protein